LESIGASYGNSDIGHKWILIGDHTVEFAVKDGNTWKYLTVKQDEPKDHPLDPIIAINMGNVYDVLHQVNRQAR
jgi:hypothetical protein